MVCKVGPMETTAGWLLFAWRNLRSHWLKLGRANLIWVELTCRAHGVLNVFPIADKSSLPSMRLGNECTHYITACHGTVSTVCWQCASSSRRADTTSLPKLVKALSNIKTSALAAGKARRSKCRAQSRNRSLVISMSGVLYSTPLFCEAKAMVITILAGGEITIQTIGACLAPHSQGMLSDAVPVGKEYRLRSPNSWPRQGLFCNANLPLGLCRMPQLCCSIAKYRRNTAACRKLEVSAIHIWWLSPRNRTPAVSSEH